MSTMSTYTMAQSANNLLGAQQSTRPLTPSVALQKLMEAVDQIQFLTRRSATQDALEDVTEPQIKFLRSKFNSRLWTLRSLWYAEPKRLVTVGRWMSRIHKETTTELDALDTHLQRRTSTAVDGRGGITGNDIPNPNDSSCLVEDQEMCSGDATAHQPVSRGDTRCNLTTPTTGNNYGNDDANTRSSKTNNCWPPIGTCHSCGFGAHQRIGTICIAHTKRCNICGTSGHMEAACKRRPDAITIRSDRYTKTSPPDLQIGGVTDMKPDQGNQCLKVTVSETNFLRHHQATDTQPEYTVEDTTKREIRQGTPVTPDMKIDTADTTTELADRTPPGQTSGEEGTPPWASLQSIGELLTLEARIYAEGVTPDPSESETEATTKTARSIGEGRTEHPKDGPTLPKELIVTKENDQDQMEGASPNASSATAVKPSRRHRCSKASPELMGLDLRDSTADLDTGTKRRAERRAARRDLPELCRLMLREIPADPTPREADDSTTVANVYTTTRSPLGEKSNQEFGTNPRRVLKITTSLGHLEHRADLDQWNEGQWNQIGCYAKPFTEADQEMSFFEGALETAFVATEHFQTMLKGSELRIYTDHAPLIGAMSYLAHGPSEDDGRMTDSMRRKLEYISQYTMIIKYRIQCCDKCREENSDDEEWPPPERLGNYPTRTESGRAHTATPVPDSTSPRFTETGLESWRPFDRHTILTPDMQQMWDDVEAEVRQERKKIPASHQRTKAGLSEILFGRLYTPPNPH